MGLWECGQSRPGPRHGRKRRKGLSTFPRPDTKKKLFIESPAGLLRNGKRRTGTGRRQRGVWEAWSIRPPNAKPERGANKDCPPLSMLSAPPRTKDASSRINRRQAEVWEECGQSRPRTRNREMARIRIVHRLSTLSAPPRTKNSRTLRETEKKTERRKTSRPNPATQPRTKTDPQQSAPDAIPPEFRRPRDTVAWLATIATLETLGPSDMRER